MVHVTKGCIQIIKRFVGTVAIGAITKNVNVKTSL